MSAASLLRVNRGSHWPAVHVTEVPTAVQLMQCAPQPSMKSYKLLKLCPQKQHVKAIC